MHTLTSSAASQEIPEKPEPFFGNSYFNSLNRYSKKNSLLYRFLTTHLGSTALGKLVDKKLSPELATRVNALTLLKIGRLACNIGATRKRLAKERLYRQLWVRFQDSVVAYAKGRPDFTLIQIGAYDGLTNDRLRPLLTSHPEWQAVLVEPMPEAFARLKHNYSDRPCTTLVKCAIVEQEGPLQMYQIMLNQNNPLFIDMTATTKPGTLNMFKGSGSDVNTVVVNGHTLQGLMSMLGMRPEEIDLLFVDAEGCDYTILSQLMNDWERLPRFVVAEHDHMTQEEYLGAVSALFDHGYDVQIIAHDILAEKIETASL